MSTELPPVYRLDTQGRRVLEGLTYEETSEFERLDASLPYAGKVVWLDGFAPLSPIETRWLELWTRHRLASEAEHDAQGAAVRT